MLTGLYISNIVLIEKLNLEFGRGLNVLTGETGAGKSILLDALSLALGARSDTGLIRHGCDGAQVTAEFDNINDDLKSVLAENGIDYDGILIMRRTLGTDGKSKAWINDVPVSIKTLKSIGDGLVEIHGQFENHSLLDQTTHRKTLDQFAVIIKPEYTGILDNVKTTYIEMQSAERRLHELSEMLVKSAAEREFLEYNINELKALNPQPGEEDDLSNRRVIMIGAEKNAAVLSDAVGAINQKGNSIDAQIFNVTHILGRIKTTPNPYQEQIDKLYEAANIVSEVSEKIIPTESDTGSLENIEERLFAIRAAARKHGVSSDELSDKLARMSEQLNAIDNSDVELKKLKSDAAKKASDFAVAAKQLTHERIAASETLHNQVVKELPALKLGQSDFIVERINTSPSMHGVDEITFMIKANPGTPFAPLHKTASGGELARMMLALRVVFGNEKSRARTFVFDEVDTGISGATASAVGERLDRLARTGQALVVTHSAQVAGFADKHFKIEKNVKSNSTTTTVTEIFGDARIYEIARIISGAAITPESVATAKTLMKN